MLRELYLWLVLVPAFLFLAYLCFYFMKQIWLGRNMMVIAKRLGLDYHPRSLFVYPAVSGTHDGLKVHLGVIRIKRRIFIRIRMFHKDGEKSRDVKSIGVKRILAEFEGMRKTFIVD